MTQDAYYITETGNCPKCKAEKTLVDTGRWEHLELPLATQETAHIDFYVPLRKCRNCAHEGISVRKVIMENEAQSWLADANAGWLNPKDTWH